jgi:ribosomal-protein-alanine N-acetyltransferase
MSPAPPARHLRPAHPADAAAVSAIHRMVFDQPWEADGLQCLLELPVVRAYIAEAGPAQELAGFIVGQLAADEAEILSVGVAPIWQRSGVATLLLRDFAASVSYSGAKRMFLEVAADNAPALALYFQQGFHCVGRRKSYYERRGQPFADALVLAKACDRDDCQSNPVAGSQAYP